MIPDEAVEAAARALALNRENDRWWTEFEWEAVMDARYKEPYRRQAILALEAAAPHMLIHVHHHDIENHAQSFNEGYETCMAQELADDPTTAQDWLDEKLREAKAEAWSHGHHDGAVDQMLHMENGEAKTTPNPYLASDTNV